MKKIRNIKLFASALCLASSLAATAPMSVYAEEEEILFENINEEHQEEDITNVNPENPAPQQEAETPTPEQQITIDDTNWNPEEHPEEGLVIPDTVLTEAERKGIVPSETPDTSKKTTIPETSRISKNIENTKEIVEMPKTGSYDGIILICLTGILVASSIVGINIYSEINATNKLEDELEDLKESKLGK